ncbi:MAG: NUDIX hydrolase [Acetobacteraceae bacterium]|nr:NUDIX hydrolase [Acetobacteraceae bacterium]MBV8521547.1 NUDIX hydrolase [Acetobacteraceae bacterium]MBV8589980.1 NUDIX hydrolase [Acetobacteraceae bacterium]
MAHRDRRPSNPAGLATELPVAHPPTAQARDAASLIIWRQTPSGISMLMGLRGAKHRFMPNRLVFPGGAVDRADFHAPFATPLPADTLRHLAKSATPELAQGLALAAARELEEETSLTLGCPPRLDGLYYLCRAVTPSSNPIRFNARFLVVDACRVSGVLAGSGELEQLRYYGLDEALAFELAWVTRKVLGYLKLWLAMPQPERLARSHTPVCESRTWTVE